MSISIDGIGEAYAVFSFPNSSFTLKHTSSVSLERDFS